MTDKQNLPWQLEELRDKFAMAAMQGILSNSDMIVSTKNASAEWAAEEAYKLADAMLKARG